jgi:hypothetical protein
MEIRKERGFPQRLEKDLAKNARLFIVPTGPTAAIHLKKGDFLSEEWGAPHWPQFRLGRFRIRPLELISNVTTFCDRVHSSVYAVINQVAHVIRCCKSASPTIQFAWIQCRRQPVALKCRSCNLSESQFSSVCPGPLGCGIRRAVQ